MKNNEKNVYMSVVKRKFVAPCVREYGIGWETNQHFQVIGKQRSRKMSIQAAQISDNFFLSDTFSPKRIPFYCWNWLYRNI